MPSITVQLLRGRTVEQKRNFAAAVTAAAVAELGARPGDVRIAFEHIEPDDVANGGVLASEDASRSSVLSNLGHSSAASAGGPALAD
ncbi:tautomerase family protein [Jiangella rhizosphaerae]|uniref:4-oxalocrotonate tautomerase n=1 Tax=Jiangella rhizosphaerae TaxID=2293569 RepID=A0A418KRZ4_9ACTN|nr:tautomerase family protein [Jiangella rhizosphaerae]RIQ26258.1 4-oxalocrotonate tautomerase [Jiangella rhizosphaerae]